MATGTNVTPVKITAVAIIFLNIEISLFELGPSSRVEVQRARDGKVPIIFGYHRAKRSQCGRNHREFERLLEDAPACSETPS